MTIRTSLLSLTFIATLVAPSFAYAAETPSLSIRSHDSNSLSIRYEHMPSKSTLTVLAPNGTEIKSNIRLPRTNGIKTTTLPKDLAGGTYTVRALSAEKVVLASATFTVEIPAPTCRMTVSDKKPSKGDMVTIRWTSENALSGFLFGKKVETHGSERIALYHTGLRGFSANFVGKGGIAGCSVKANVTE